MECWRRSPFTVTLERVGTIRFGSVMVFVAQIVLALSVSTRAVCDPLPRPVILIETAWAVEDAFTSLMHAFVFCVKVIE